MDFRVYGGVLVGLTNRQNRSHRVWIRVFEVYRSEAFAAALGLHDYVTDLACEFVRLPGGRFRMGNAGGGGLENEFPRRELSVGSFLDCAGFAGG